MLLTWPGQSQCLVWLPGWPAIRLSKLHKSRILKHSPPVFNHPPFCPEKQIGGVSIEWLYIVIALLSLLVHSFDCSVFSRSISFSKQMVFLLQRGGRGSVSKPGRCNGASPKRPSVLVSSARALWLLSAGAFVSAVPGPDSVLRTCSVVILSACFPLSLFRILFLR